MVTDRKPLLTGGCQCGALRYALYAPPEVARGAPRLLLHACALAFAHPEGGQRVQFASATPF